MISGKTKIVGIFGENIDYTLSPKMHNHAFAALGLDYVYVPFDVRSGRLKDAVAALRSVRNLSGVNVTVPYKKEILPFLNELSPLAKRIEAVNAISKRGTRLVGHNTDAEGFLKSLKEKFEPKRKTATIIGAGGTAYAIAFALAGAGIKQLQVLNRTSGRAEWLRRNLLRNFPKVGVTAGKLNLSALEQSLIGCDLLVSTVPTGLERLADRLPKSLLSRAFVFDVAYAKETPLLKAARRGGSRHMDGLGMLVHQGALAFELWTGKKPPVALMREALRGKLKK